MALGFCNCEPISSRALHVPWDEAGCLCPVGDFFNYAASEDERFSEIGETEASPAQLSSLCENNDTARNSAESDFPSQRLTDGGYEDDETAYCFYARKRYKKGEQVLLCYGTYTNLELLEHYGFILNVNPNDKAFIPLDADICTSSSWPKDILFLQHDGRPSFALLSTLRLWVTPHNLRRTVGHQAYSGLQLSVDNEITVMRWLAERCQDVLREMPTSVADDCSTKDAIDNMLKCASWKDCMDLLSCEGELKAFFQVNTSNEGVSGFPLSRKLKTSLGRTRLALQWRIIYKTALLNCISYCVKVVEMVSSRSASGNEANKEI
uniref:Protein SET DOMAIN GROUP 40 n=1 Tax=Anthurium amnicola TaxID=1678845 RepID=A0A1D1YUS9_9ARAE